MLMLMGTNYFNHAAQGCIFIRTVFSVGHGVRIQMEFGLVINCPVQIGRYDHGVLNFGDNDDIHIIWDNGPWCMNVVFES